MYDAVAAAEPADHAWKLEIGQCATHVDQAMPSLVMWRCDVGPSELYGVRSFATVDPQRDRMIMGGSLRRAVFGSHDCDDCLLAGTCLCPGLPGA